MNCIVDPPFYTILPTFSSVLAILLIDQLAMIKLRLSTNDKLITMSSYFSTTKNTLLI